MSCIRVTTVVPTVAEMPLWVREALNGATIAINLSESDESSFAVSREWMVHGLRYHARHPDSQKAADYFELYFRVYPGYLYFRKDWCELLP